MWANPSRLPIGIPLKITIYSIKMAIKQSLFLLHEIEFLRWPHTAVGLTIEILWWLWLKFHLVAPGHESFGTKRFRIFHPYKVWYIWCVEIICRYVRSIAIWLLVRLEQCHSNSLCFLVDHWNLFFCLFEQIKLKLLKQKKIAEWFSLTDIQTRY